MLQQVTTGPILPTGTVLSLVSFTVPNNAVFWITSNQTFTPSRFMYSLKLTDTAPRAPITKDTTMTFRMRHWLLQFHLSIVGISLPSQVSYLSPCHHLVWQHQLWQPLSPSYQMSGLLASIIRSSWETSASRECEIPQYLEVFTFHHSLRLICSHQLLTLSNLHLLQSCQWTRYRATVSCLLLFFFSLGVDIIDCFRTDCFFD